MDKLRNGGGRFVAMVNVGVLEKEESKIMRMEKHAMESVNNNFELHFSTQVNQQTTAMPLLCGP